MPLTQPHPAAILLMMALLAAIVAVWVSVVLRFALEKPILPPNTPRIVPWGAGTVLGSILLWFAMQASAGLIYRLATKPPKIEGVAAPASSFGPTELMALSAAGNVGAVILIPLLLAATSRARPRDLGFEGPRIFDKVAQGVLAYPLLAPCVFGLMLLVVWIWGKSTHPLQEAMMGDRSPLTVALLAFAGVIMAPISEELVFRGVLLGWLTKLALIEPSRAESKPETAWSDEVFQDPRVSEGSYSAPIAVEAVDTEDANPYAPPRAGIVAAIPATTVGLYRPGRVIMANAVVSAVFALLHGPQWPAPVPLFVLSMGLGLLYQRTGSLIGPIALHMTFNGVSTLLLFLASAGTPPPVDPKIPNPIPGPASTLVAAPNDDFARGRPLTRDNSRL